MRIIGSNKLFSKNSASDNLVAAGKLLLNVAIEQCPKGWVYCPVCMSAFTDNSALLLDQEDDSCPHCRNKDELIHDC